MIINPLFKKNNGLVSFFHLEILKRWRRHLKANIVILIWTKFCFDFLSLNLYLSFDRFILEFSNYYSKVFVIFLLIIFWIRFLIKWCFYSSSNCYWNHNVSKNYLYVLTFYWRYTYKQMADKWSRSWAHNLCSFSLK